MFIPKIFQTFVYTDSSSDGSAVSIDTFTIVSLSAHEFVVRFQNCENPEGCEFKSRLPQPTFCASITLSFRLPSALQFLRAPLRQEVKFQIKNLIS